MLAGSAFSFEGSMGEDPYQDHSHDCGQDSVTHRLLDLGPQFLADYWLEATPVPCHVGLSIEQLTIWQLASLGASEQERVPEQATACCNLILDVTHTIPPDSFYWLQASH